MSILVVFAQVAGRQTAFEASEVRSVIDLEQVVPVPGAPSHVAGLAALRSQALTVIDTKRAIDGNVDDATVVDDDTPENRAIVVEIEGHAFALLVENVSDVIALEGETMPVPGTFGEGWLRSAKGMVETARGPALLLDPMALLSVDGRKSF